MHLRPMEARGRRHVRLRLLLLRLGRLHMRLREMSAAQGLVVNGGRGQARVLVVHSLWKAVCGRTLRRGADTRGLEAVLGVDGVALAAAAAAVLLVHV